MLKLKRIGCEFLGIDSSERSFPKLKSLTFGWMDNLEEWDLSMKDVMPRLKHLTVRNCRKLKRIPPLGNLELLETLEISGISSFECISGKSLGISNGESIPTVVFPKLKKLEFEFMKEWEVGDDEHERHYNYALSPGAQSSLLPYVKVATGMHHVL
ncbi:hypothetical protein GIB67_027463 [Kingdonia uniflora]|uniref:Uncharacterized protein n=1 Tax=Kingdonia uniflora TaxID=39325 RepID=A0A7J7MFC8_9MAGN|nr:hypothetical protein GIB67_027463 [Kingdonia uniflora]